MDQKAKLQKGDDFSFDLKELINSEVSKVENKSTIGKFFYGLWCRLKLFTWRLKISLSERKAKKQTAVVTEMKK